jgi:dihydrofolate synthase/folylpolyglutamate synthase
MAIDFNEEFETRLMDFIQNNYGGEVFTPGLDRTRPLYLPYILKLKARKVKTTIIAGTNGKGQTAHSLGHYLKKADAGYALWTSPHILSLRERFRFNDEDISYEELEKEIEEAHQEVKEHSGLIVSFYEFLFLVFLRLAVEKEIDHLILEVGLGGRLDAVNHFDADVCCITSISRDHQSILGNRFDLILAEKIAVSRPGRILITQFQLKYLNELTEVYCRENGILWLPLPPISEINQNYFDQNKRMARELFKFLEPAKTMTESELPAFKGRREVMTFKGNTLIFIGAHNIDGVRSMTQLFHCESKSFWPSQLLISFSKRPVNEVEVMMKTLQEQFGNDCKLTLTCFEHPKALEMNNLLEVEKKVSKIKKGMFDFVIDWKTYLSSTSNEKILVCGSYYFVGEVQRFILSNHL